MQLQRYPRVAFFAGGLEEPDGAAWTGQHLLEFASRNSLPFLTVRLGSQNSFERCGEIRHLSLDRSQLAHHSSQVRQGLSDFRPDVIHVTSPGAAGLLGLYGARRLGVPVVASWHTHKTNRVARYLASRFYSRATVVLATNEDMVRILQRETAKPAFLVPRGVDTSLFAPHKRLYADGISRIGFAGRLSAETNVRFLVELEQTLCGQVSRPFRFLVVGDGSERVWLEKNLRNAEFTGVLQGEALARAYARMDMFVSPSTAATPGSSVLEVMASGVPAVVFAHGGDRFFVEHGISGFVSLTHGDFLEHVSSLLKNRELRRRMALASCLHARQWSWESVCEATYRAYRLAVRSASGNAGAGFSPRADGSGLLMPAVSSFG